MEAVACAPLLYVSTSLFEYTFPVSIHLPYLNSPIFKVDISISISKSSRNQLERISSLYSPKMKRFLCTQKDIRNTGPSTREMHLIGMKYCDDALSTAPIRDTNKATH